VSLHPSLKILNAFLVRL